MSGLWRPPSRVECWKQRERFCQEYDSKKLDLTLVSILVVICKCWYNIPDNKNNYACDLTWMGCCRDVLGQHPQISSCRELLLCSHNGRSSKHGTYWHGKHIWKFQSRVIQIHSLQHLLNYLDALALVELYLSSVSYTSDRNATK